MDKMDDDAKKGLIVVGVLMVVGIVLLALFVLFGGISVRF